jgi:hypothetical protein
MKKLITACAVIVLFGKGYAMAGTWTSIDAPNSTYTQIYGIDGGKVVGQSHGVYNFLYDGTTWTTLDFPGAEGTYIEGISGNTLAGWYSYNPNGAPPHGFLYTIPEPATVLLLGFGAVMLRRRGITIYY